MIISKEEGFFPFNFRPVHLVVYSISLVESLIDLSNLTCLKLDSWYPQTCFFFILPILISDKAQDLWHLFLLHSTSSPEKAMAPHSSTLAWKIPWTEEPGRLQSMGSLSDFTFTFHFHALEKEMATHSSVLAWRIPGTGEPGGLPSMGLHRVGHD